MENQSKRKTVAIIATIFMIAFFCIVYVSQSNTSAPNQPSQTQTEAQIPTPSPEDLPTIPVEDKDATRKAIETSVSAWIAGEMSYEDAVKELQRHQSSVYPELASLAQDQLAYIQLEEKCNKLFSQAEGHLATGEYAETFRVLNGIDPKYSKYPVVEGLYHKSERAVLQAVKDPQCIGDFESYIHLLGDCLAFCDSAKLVNRQEQLSDELVIFIDVSDTIQRATELYDAQKYEESFMTLALGIDKYPDEQRLSTSLVDYHDHYIINVTKSAIALCEEEEYKAAIKTVEAAIEEYDCQEFQSLLESIKEQKSFLYRFKNDVVEKFNVLAQGWESEEFDVKHAAASTGAYIVKSGEKMFLGDYSEEDITVLSFGGNIVASLANIDFLFDLRDLTYDVIHWGDGECFAVYLATDVIALLPVVGVVKYFGHFKTVADGVKSADLVDSVSDISKGTANAVEVADTVKDVTKTGNSIIEAVDSARDTARYDEVAKGVYAEITGEYKIIKTINQDFLGTKHPITGVEFVLRKLKYSSGEAYQGVFPVFASFADIELPKDLYKAKFKDQQEYCLERLQKQTRPIFGKYRKNFTEEQLDDIKAGVLPAGFTWHHNEEEGLMQLVDTVTHDLTGHKGGMSLWGIGYD